MPSHLLVAGLDARSLILEAPILQRERAIVEERTSAREVLQDLAASGARLLVLGSRLPDLALPETIRRIRTSPVIRHVSIMVLLTASETRELELACREAGGNAVLRRPVDRFILESWIAKLLMVPRRVDARIPVEGQVVGTHHGLEAVHFFGLTRNVSANGMLLASPIRLPGTPDLDLDLLLEDVPLRLKALGRVVREAPEVAWPHLGYGIEFLVIPPETAECLARLVDLRLGSSLEQGPGIHSTLARDEWIYEILEPLLHQGIWQAEIRRGPRRLWRPGTAGPLYVVEGSSRENALRAAGEFVRRYSRSPRE
jgi:CheY-like chemotaxis protein